MPPAAGPGRAPREADVYLPLFLSQRGKTVPEELVKPEELSKYRQVASHVVSAAVRDRGSETRGEGGGSAPEPPPRRLPRSESPRAPSRASPFPFGVVLPLGAFIRRCPTSRRGCTAPASRESSPWTSALPTPTRSSPVREPGSGRGVPLAVLLGGRGGARGVLWPRGKAPQAGGHQERRGWARAWPAPHPSPAAFPGGADKNVIVFDKSSEQILATLKGHSKKVTSVVFHPSQVRSELFPRGHAAPKRRSGPCWGGLSASRGPGRCGRRGGAKLSRRELPRLAPSLGVGVLRLSRRYDPDLVRAQRLMRAGRPCPRGLRDGAEPPRDG